MYKDLSYKLKWYGANDNDALIPEKWAMEGLAILEENMVVAGLVYRDFENELASSGDIVNTRLPANMTATRKIDGDTVTTSDATLTNIPVPLNQHIHTSFIIYDGEESKSFKDLVATHLEPAVISIASRIDLMLCTQAYRFEDNQVGSLGSLTSSTAQARILSCREKMNENKNPVGGRYMIWNTASETTALNTDLFISAERVGDGGRALREASLGRKFGFDHFMCQNMPYIATGSTAVTGAINLTAGYAAGSTSFTVDGFSAAITAGSYVTIEGDMTPQRVVSTTGGATPTTLVLSPGIASAVVNDAVVTVYTPGAVNNSDGYAAGYGKKIAVDGFTVAPKTGQMVSFGTSTVRYAIMSASTTEIELDRPLDSAITNDLAVCIGPAGEYNFFFRKDALALVNRPLAAVRRGTGALSSVMNYNGVALRVTIAYDADTQGHRVTVDTLCGVAQLSESRGGLLLG